MAATTYTCCRNYPQLPRMETMGRDSFRKKKAPKSRLQKLVSRIRTYMLCGTKRSQKAEKESQRRTTLQRIDSCEGDIGVEGYTYPGPPTPTHGTPHAVSPMSLGGMLSGMACENSYMEIGDTPDNDVPSPVSFAPGIILWGEEYNNNLLEKTYESINTADLDSIDDLRYDPKSSPSAQSAPPPPPRRGDVISRRNRRNAVHSWPTSRLAWDTQSLGQLKFSIKVTRKHSLEVHKARDLPEPTCSFVKISIVPELDSRTLCQTGQAFHKKNPVYNENFVVDLLEGDEKKRLYISMWTKGRKGLAELQGCMSFSISTLLQQSEKVNGWYYLLTEDLGKRKHLPVKSRPSVINLSSASDPETLKNIPEVHKDLMWMDSVTIVIKRGRHGYGFTVLGCSPVKVGRVEDGSPAAAAGLRKDDYVVRINGQNVSRSMADSVAKIVRQSDKQIILDIHRPGPDSQFDTSTPVPPRHGLQPINEYDEHVGSPGSHITARSELIGKGETLQEVLSHREECRESGIDVGRRRAARCLTKAEPQLTLAHQDLSSQEMERQQAIQKLISLTDDYIKQMSFGVQRYSRPLLHDIISQAEHNTLFQNVEALVAFSEYIRQRLTENSVVYSDLDNSEDRYIDTVGGIFQPKAEVMADSYESYCNGIKNSFRLLMDLREYKEFDEFIKNPQGLECGQCTIAGFIQKPLEHIKDLFLVLQKILVNTRLEHHDYLDLGLVVEMLRTACNRINECNTRRSRSTLSLASSKHGTSTPTTSRTSQHMSRSSGRSSSSHNSSTSDQSANCSHESGSSSEHSPSSSSSKSCVSAHSSGSMSTHSSHSGSLSHSDQSQGTTRTAHTLGGQSVCSAVSISSIDTEVLDVQSRLRFRDNMPSFQLATPTRHMIYSGPLQQVHDRGTTSLWVVLMSDLLLLTKFEADEFLSVIEDPIILHNVINVESSRVHPADFCLLIDYSNTHNSTCPFGGTRIIMLRAPTIEQKCTWKNVLEQRVVSCKVQREEMARADNIV